MIVVDWSVFCVFVFDCDSGKGPWHVIRLSQHRGGPASSLRSAALLNVGVGGDEQKVFSDIQRCTMSSPQLLHTRFPEPLTVLYPPGS